MGTLIGTEFYPRIIYIDQPAVALNPLDVHKADTSAHGIEELTMVYALRYDQDADPPTFAYLGEALPGTATSAAGWRVKKLTFGVDGDVTTLWADGNSNLDNVWDNRASFSYS